MLLSSAPSRPRALLGLLLALGLCTGCAIYGPQRLEDLPYRTGSIERDGRGTVLKGLLVETLELDGMSYTSWIRFYPDGEVKDAQLADGQRVLDIPLPRSTRLFWSPAGILTHAWLGADVTLDGVHCAGGWKISASFYPSGRLRSASLQEDQKIGGVPCAASLMQPVTLDEQGRVTSCRLAEDWLHEGTLFEKGETWRRQGE